jgi:hypothetical protein
MKVQGQVNPVIFCKSKLFSLEAEEMHNIQSARIFIRNLDFKSRYVDVVSFDMAQTYIDQLVSHFEKSSAIAIRKTWDLLGNLDWNPGQAAAQLADALGLKKTAR